MYLTLSSSLSYSFSFYINYRSFIVMFYYYLKNFLYIYRIQNTHPQKIPDNFVFCSIYRLFIPPLSLIDIILTFINCHQFRNQFSVEIGQISAIYFHRLLGPKLKNIYIVLQTCKFSIYMFVLNIESRNDYTSALRISL